MRPWSWVLAALLPLGLLTGCSDEPPPAPATVASLDPCALLTDRERDDLNLRVEHQETAGHRRSCTFFSTSFSDSGRRIEILDLTIRDSRAPNRVADARRIADTYQRERQATVTTTTLDGRDIYHVKAEKLGCFVLFTVNATSSLEAAPRIKDSTDCAMDDLSRLLAGKLPAPDPQPARADHDRPTDVLALHPCELIGADRKTSLGLDQGTFSTKVQPSCIYHTNATGQGQLSFVSVTIWTTGARSLSEDDNPTTGAINDRVTYETRETTGPGAGAIADCVRYLEVTTATSVQIRVSVLGQDPGPACPIVTQLATDLEPLLPLIVT